MFQCTSRYQGCQRPFSRADTIPAISCLRSTLCQQYDVSRITVRQALNLLIQDMAFSVHGKGTFVNLLPLTMN
ncbi:GntR family transcriptional regulator [Enterocloster sp.]|uniref:GntR family transcriptional regulator n=1 Tax=Enterocloster sp. TaxID=2719315 RepID=UPI0039A39777